MKLKKDFLTLTVTLTLVIVVLQLVGITCPIKHILGISCPGCGMTRAYISAMTLQFDKAFYYHPLWPFVPVFGVLYFLTRKDKHKSRVILFISTIVVMLSVWGVRMAFGPSEIVRFEPKESAIFKLFNLI